MEKINADNFDWLIELGIINLNEKSFENKKKLFPDSLTNNCFTCGTKFTFLGRPNHCYLCYKFYCNSCINKLQKIKLCKNCLILCQKFSQSIDTQLIKTKENNKSFIEKREAFYCKTFNDKELSWLNFVTKEKVKYEKKLLKSENDLYEIIIKTLINYVLRINFDDEKIVDEWKEIIYKLIKEVILNLRPCTRFLNDSLDINKFIKIKLIPYKDNSKTKVIHGYILQNKKGKNIINDIPNPKILILNKKIKRNYNNNKDNNNNANNNNIDNSKTIELYNKNLVRDKLNLIKPNIILVGKDFPQKNIDILINKINLKNISIIYNIKNEVIKKLSRSFQTLILPSFKLIGSNHIFGTCERFYIEKYSEIDENHNNIINNEEQNKENNNLKEDEKQKKEKNENDFKNNKKDNDLYIFDGCNSLLFNTIILSGKDLDLLKKLKKIMQNILLPTIRDLFLQKYLKYTLNMEISSEIKKTDEEIELLDELLEESHELKPIKDGGFSIIGPLNRDSKRLERLSQRLSKIDEEQKSDIEKLFYEGFDLSIIEKKEDFKIYTLASLLSSQKDNKKKNANEDEEIKEKEIYNIVNKYCDISKETFFSFFNENTKYDQSLGRFILGLGKNKNSICSTCKIEYQKHTHYFFRSKGVLKFWMISGNENDLDLIINYLKEKTKIDYSKILVYNKKDFNSIFEIINSDIYTYGYCNICKGIVTPLFKIGNEVFNYSSSKFIRSMLENHLSKNKIRRYEYNTSEIINNRRKYGKKKNEEEKIIPCNHKINKDISRIFVTRFGSWVFEYNDIKIHYLTPLNLNINNSITKTIYFKKYNDEGYSNSRNAITLIQKALESQENFFKQLLEDEKLIIFKSYINQVIGIIKSLYNYNKHNVLDLINKYFKTKRDEYDNNFIKLIAHIKTIYLRIVKIKLIANRVERARNSIKMISDILNEKLPITLEEYIKYRENLIKEKKIDKINTPSPEINFSKDTSFGNILTFINYSDNKHDYFSCEFIQDDLSSFIANILSSNEYINFMKSKEGLNLALIKKSQVEEKLINDIITDNLSNKKRFSSIHIVKEKESFFKQIDKGIQKKISLDNDENKEENDNFDTLLIFDQSKQFFFVENEDAEIYTNEKIKQILEEELMNEEKEHKTIVLSNDLYSILIRKRKTEENKKQIDNISPNSSRNNTNNFSYINNLANSNSTINLANSNSTINLANSNSTINLANSNSNIILSNSNINTNLSNSNINTNNNSNINLSNNNINTNNNNNINLSNSNSTIHLANNNINQSNNDSIINFENNNSILYLSNINDEQNKNNLNEENNENKLENEKTEIINKKTKILNKEFKDDFKTVKTFLKKKENELINSTKLFEGFRQNLIKIIKSKIEKGKNDKESLKGKKSREINEEKIIKENKEDNKKNIEEDQIIKIENKEKEDNIIEDNKDNKNDNIEDKNEEMANLEKNLPNFHCIPEFESIEKENLFAFFEEKVILLGLNKIEVTIYYAKKFEALRIAYCSNLEDLLVSLSKSDKWAENSGGKSKAGFYKTSDQRFILKSMNENEFNMFIDSGVEYFKYMSKFLFHKNPSVLAKILGAYKIVIKQKDNEIKYHLILMENIYFGINFKYKTTFNSPNSNIRVYDLKGSTANRYIKKKLRKDGKVLLDTNFVVDFNKEPVFIESNVYDRLKVALHNDSDYLSSLDIVDYSLLLILDDKGKEKEKKKENEEDKNKENKENYSLIKLGIIDYTRKYTLDKQLESMSKTILYGRDPTIVDPNAYSKRFYQSIIKYFVGV